MNPHSFSEWRRLGEYREALGEDVQVFSSGNIIGLFWKGLKIEADWSRTQVFERAEEFPDSDFALIAEIVRKTKWFQLCARVRAYRERVSG